MDLRGKHHAPALERYRLAPPGVASAESPAKAPAVNVPQAQREMRDVYLNAGPGEAVAALVWLLSAICGTWVSPTAGVLSLVFGGMLIFPLTQLSLAALGRRTAVSAANPLRPLAPQIALLVPLIMPLAFAAMFHRAEWFYPAFMVIVGAHYWPFAFLYGARRYVALAALLVVGGYALAFSGWAFFAAGAWFTAAVLFAFAGFGFLRRERDTGADAG